MPLAAKLVLAIAAAFGLGGVVVALVQMRSHPKGLKVLFFTEMWERFSFYGMRALLSLYMITPAAGGGLGFSKSTATLIYGSYGMLIYLMSLPGGWMADRFLGYRRAVVTGGVILACGHLCLAFSPLPFFFGGLVLIIVGTGMLKTNCTTMVGMLYPQGDARRDGGYSIYYMGINLGAFIAPLVCGYMGQDPAFVRLLQGAGLATEHGWHWGFAAAAVAMTLGLVQFKIQEHKLGEVGLHSAHQDETKEQLAHEADPALRARLLPKAMAIFSFIGAVIVTIAALGLFPPLVSLPLGALAGAAFGYVNWDYVDLTGDEKKRLGAIGLLIFFSMLFWAIFEQAGTTLTFFADEQTDCRLFGWAFPSSWFQSVNSLFIMVLAPVFAWGWTAMGTKEPSSPSKFAIGVFCVGAGFLLLASPAKVFALTHSKASPLFLVVTYFIHTIGELSLSPVGLSATSKLAPDKFKSLMMGVFFLSISFGYKIGGYAAGLTEKLPAAQIFTVTFYITTVSAVALLALVPTIKGLMGGEPEAGAH